MFESIPPTDVYNKNINMLIGSGASADLFPTLQLAIKGTDGAKETIETLATKFEHSHEKLTALFMHYYNTCVFPAQVFNSSLITSNEEKANLDNYEILLATLLGLLDKRKDLNRKINIFTTNYDGCLAHSADKLIEKGSHDFVVNDGTSGFRRKHLHAKNFNTFLCQTGIFERSNYGIPQLNIIHLHGSVYWSKSGERIEVNYRENFNNILPPKISGSLANYSDFLGNADSKTDDIPALSFDKKLVRVFWEEYNKLPIVNPTKWKFHETVFEEHYYQMLRLLSYELERPNSILITFGFSFADEHILKLIQRSLSNPLLQTFICCYSHRSAMRMKDEFRPWKNVKVIGPPEKEKNGLHQLQQVCIFAKGRGIRTTNERE